MLMKTPMAAALIALGGTLALANDPATTSLPRSTPEAQGVSSAALLKFVEALDREIEGMHSVMVVRRGHVIAEGWWTPYAAEHPHMLYSLSKSFTSTAVGLAIAEGKLSVDDEVLKFFPDDAPESPSPNLKSMRVRDLLRMSTGHQSEPPRPADRVWTKVFLEHTIPFKPSTHFLYNTSATYMLSAIVQKVTGQTVLDYLKPRLFEPLGIENPTWELSPQGIATGGYGLSVRTEDIAKFGQLYLQKGKWRGKQIVPEAWVEAATKFQTSNGSNPKSDWDQGYGYQFWRARHNAYRGDGAFGQYCVVMPDHDTVLAITSGVKDMQAVLNVAWDQLLPALKESSSTSDDDAAKRLQEALKGLSIKPQEGTATPEKARELLGKTYKFPTNPAKIESLTLRKADEGDGVKLVFRVDGQERSISAARGSWSKGRFGLGPMPEGPAAASGAWTGDDTFKAKVCFVETPYLATLTFKFDGDKVTMQSQANVGFGPTRTLPLTGKAE